MYRLPGYTSMHKLLFIVTIALLTACEDKPKPLPIRLDIVAEDTTTHFNYSPAVSELYGTLYEATFVKETDVIEVDPEADSTMVEKEFILLLKHPISVNADTTDGFNDEQNNITKVQLVPIPDNARAYLNQRVKVTGKLWGAQTAHHHTPVLIEVTTIEANGY